MRATFRVRTRRDSIIFPLIGMAYIIANMACLSASSTDTDKRLLLASIKELFSAPGTAASFMEKTFTVWRRGLVVGGRLTRNRHVFGQPPAFRAAEFNNFFNPKGSLAQ